MNVLFVMDRRVNAGSIRAVAGYVAAGDKLGHRFALYGHPDDRFPGIRFAADADGVDYVVFIVESSLSWMTALRLPRILAAVPRECRVVLDADGMFNEQITVGDYDRNHASESDCAYWRSHYAQLADRVFQPTLAPSDPRVIPVPFYGYDEQRELPLDRALPKRYDIVHVAHNWWRWQVLATELLPAFAQIRSRLDGICFVGSWWNGAPPATPEHHLPAFRVDRDAFERLRIRVKPAVHFTKVVHVMSEGRVNVMTQRPLFRRLRLLTSKYFEIFAADTIPLVLLEVDHAEAVYGPAGRELALHGPEIGEQIANVITRPERYRGLVAEVRAALRENHSYDVRVGQLTRALAGEA
jgi:hypothetical protein